MKTSALLRGVDILAQGGDLPEHIERLTHDSREAVAGAAFVALAGTQVDGHRYLRAVAKQGAALAVVQTPPDGEVRGMPWILVASSRRALALMAANWHGRPSESMIVLGVTGTNGKTTTAYLIRSILEAAGHSVGLLSTIEVSWPGHQSDSVMTTPDPLVLQQRFAHMREAGVDAVVMEVSSHALHQHRVDGVAFTAAGFTNLGWDHLDYHATRQAYAAAKRRLFSQVLPQSARATGAAICIDGEFGDEFVAATPLQALRCSSQRPAADASVDVAVEQARYEPTGIRGTLRIAQKTVEFHSALVGPHNAQNIAVAAAIAHLAGVGIDDIARGVEALEGVPGRLQRVPAEALGVDVYVDYAHTPDALESVLQGLRQASRGRIVTVFGCGGDRDAGKREAMGRVAGALSSVVLVTSDNPRSESPEAIAAQAAQGVQAAGLAAAASADQLAGGCAYRVEVDRRRAIGLALQAARPGDVVLIAGKGHERTQETAGVRVPFDDVQVASELASALAAGRAGGQPGSGSGELPSAAGGA